jgi:alpha-mannosidase
VDVRRNEILLWNNVKPGQDHILAIEAFSGLESHQHLFEQADLVLINEDVENFYYNSKIVYETMQAVGENDLRSSHILNILEQALLQVDLLEIGSRSFFQSINNANKYLCTELYAKVLEEKFPAVVGTGHAHLDIAWMWQTKHSKKKAARTFANALQLMEIYPEFTFAQSQAQLYKYVQEYYPTLFKRVREKIKNGRWEATGGMWVESDCNIPGGESLVRQFLYGKRYFKKEFGVDIKVVWLPDVFGFCYSLPQIIKKCAMSYFMTTKLSWSQFTKFPYDTFYWEGLDGTRILAHFITTPDRRGWNDYSVDLNPVNVKACWDNYHQKQENQEVLISFGWGDGGGGVTRDMLENARRLNYMKVLPNYHHGNIENFFADLKNRVSELPVWNDEFYLQLHRGCYTSQAKIKKNNRLSEVLYHNAELFAAMCYLKTGRYPRGDLNPGWEKILLNQFHDILPGSSIAEVYQDSALEYKLIMKIGNEYLDQAMQKICTKLNPVGSESLLAVFNPLSWTRTDMVRMPCVENFKHFEIVDKAGRSIPYQLIHDEKEILLFLTDIPSMGYALFKIKSVNSPQSFSSKLFISKHKLENQFFRMTLSGEGLIEEIYDKRYGRSIIKEDGLGNVLQVFEDRPVTNDAWDIDIFYQDKCKELREADQIEIKEQGPIRGGIQVTRKYLDSTITQHIYIYDQIPRIDFYTEIDWQQHQTLLKTAFPLNIHNNKATYEIPFGTIERPTHWNTDWDRGRFEVPAQKWADVSEGDYGMSLINDCKYGYDIKDSIMRLTLLKSAVDPDPNADIGHHEFCYTLYPHTGDWRDGGTVRMAYQFNYPLISRIIKAKSHTKVLSDYSMVRVNPGNVIVETIKKAEDSKAIIFRVYEAHNQRGEAQLEFAHTPIKVEECNLLEQERKHISFINNIVKFYILPYEIKTFIVEFRD